MCFGQFKSKTAPHIFDQSHLESKCRGLLFVFGLLKSCIHHLLLSWVMDETEAIGVVFFNRTQWSCSNKDNGCYLHVDPKDNKHFPNVHRGR